MGNGDAEFGGQLGEEDGRAQRDGDGDEHGYDGGEERAEIEGRAPKAASLDGVPIGGGEEAQAETRMAGFAPWTDDREQKQEQEQSMTSAAAEGGAVGEAVQEVQQPGGG